MYLTKSLFSTTDRDGLSAMQSHLSQTNKEMFLINMTALEKDFIGQTVKGA